MMILVVEDNDSLREALSEGLRLRGHQVHAVGTMAAARDAIKHLKLQAVITDGIFPGHHSQDIAMWGFDVMHLAWMEHIPAVLVSGENVLVHEARARGHQALVKPASVEQILDALEAEQIDDYRTARGCSPSSSGLSPEDAIRRGRGEE